VFPAPEIVPPVVLQVRFAFAEPETLVVMLCDAPAVNDAVCGVIETETLDAAGGSV
jgi:hypothetical protein